MKRKRAAFILAVLVITSLPAFGIFGVGDVVFDPQNYQQAITQLLQLEKEYEQLVRTYETVRGEYEQMLFMGKRLPVDMISRYRLLVSPWEKVR